MPPESSAYPPQLPADNEQPIVIRRHIFGLVVLYVEVIVGILAGMGLIYFLTSNFVDETNRTRVYQALGVLGIAAIVLAVLMLMAATYIYRSCKMIITSTGLTQVLQTGLLSRRTSQLNLSHLEDVTAEQNGLFPRLFNFGTVYIETAGEEENFHFIFCPEPDKCAKLILDNHQAAIDARR